MKKVHEWLPDTHEQAVEAVADALQFECGHEVNNRYVLRAVARLALEVVLNTPCASCGSEATHA